MEQKAIQVLEKSFGSSFLITQAKFWDFAVHSPKITHSSATALAGGHPAFHTALLTQLSRADLENGFSKHWAEPELPFCLWSYDDLESHFFLWNYTMDYSVDWALILISLVLLMLIQFVRNAKRPQMVLRFYNSYIVHVLKIHVLRRSYKWWSDTTWCLLHIVPVRFPYSVSTNFSATLPRNSTVKTFTFWDSLLSSYTVGNLTQDFNLRMTWAENIVWLWVLLSYARSN